MYMHINSDGKMYNYFANFLHAEDNVITYLVIIQYNTLYL